jgi:hypothetical protein
VPIVVAHAPDKLTLSRGCAPSKRKAYRRRRPECPQERPSLQSARRIARPEIRRAVGRLDYQWEAALAHIPKASFAPSSSARRAATGERLNHMYFACPAVIAANMPQARSIFRFVAGLLKAVPLMRPKLVDETTETIVLDNRVVIEITTASFRTTTMRHESASR